MAAIEQFVAGIDDRSQGIEASPRNLADLHEAWRGELKTIVIDDAIFDESQCFALAWAGIARIDEAASALQEAADLIAGAGEFCLKLAGLISRTSPARVSLVPKISPSTKTIR